MNIMNGRWIAVLAAMAVVAAGGTAALGGKSAHDLSVKLKVKDSRTLGPLAMIKVKNKGSSPEYGVLVRVCADDPDAIPLWSGTVDILPGKSASFKERVYPDGNAVGLVLAADPGTAADEVPWDNTSRAAMWVTGKWGTALVGRDLYARTCAECHGDAGIGAGGTPAIRGISAGAAFAKAHAAGDPDHDFPWLTKADAKALSLYLKDPEGVIDPPPPPTPPPGGWPTYAVDVAPLLEQSCKPCHFGGSVEAHVRLDNYAAAAGWAKPSLASIKRGSMPRDKRRWTSEEIGILEDWITGGKRP